MSDLECNEIHLDPQPWLINDWFGYPDGWVYERRTKEDALTEFSPRPEYSQNREDYA